ncbi:MAG TPA: S9 family peptidase [Pyrinomonadaceae bacterium]|nr:S9 family peptidase [Pyrinomonadaceae bacterium]
MKFCRLFLVALIVTLTTLASHAQNGRHVPTIDELLTLQTIGAVQISPDGKWIAYTVGYGDFKQDGFVNQIWLAEVNTGRTFQVTRGDKSSTSPRWSPDSSWLTFLSNRVDDKNQIFAINPAGGESIQLTKSETAINGFAWSEDGKSIAYLATEPAPQVAKDRKEYLGDFEVIRKEYNFSHLWTFNVSEALNGPIVGKQRTKKKDFSVDSFAWSPDGSRIAFGATINPDLIQGETDDIYLLNLSDDSVRKIVSQPGPDTGPRWSPDGKQLVFSTSMGRLPTFATNTRLALVSVDGGTPKSITDDFDENAGLLDWKATGIYFTALQKTAAQLFRLDPVTGKMARLSQPDGLLAGGFSLNKDARQIAFTAGSPTTLSELFVTSADKWEPRGLTKMTAQISDFSLGTRELVSWKSTDGAEIEGVLIKPADFDPAKKYPLLCIIHGGPTGIDRPILLSPESRTYPADLWVARGALVLKVNYRGSAGYGEKFRKLNIRNLGVGDAWDVISGIDNLIAKGWVDRDKVACMGWSQGGYISAFLTASSDRFVAISVGAGISDWATYYYNTDITPFTINYLGDNPVNDPAIYQKTSPVAYIKSARTPTLIQHGELDRRVPIANAYQLRQALEDKGVKVEMIVYKGFGHGITKPKAQRAVMQHNLGWFNHYIFNDPLPDFASPVIPKQPKE